MSSPLLLLAANAVAPMLVLSAVPALALFFGMWRESRSVVTGILCGLFLFGVLGFLVVSSVGLEAAPRPMQPWGIP